jgi:hypothetical protein
LVDQTKLEIVDKHVLVIVEQELTGLGAEYRLERSEGEFRTNRLGESDWGGLLELVPGHQLMRGATGQPEDDSDVVARGAVAVTIVLDAQHNRTCHLVQSAEVEVLGLEELSSVGAAAFLQVSRVSSFSHHIRTFASMTLTVGRVRPESTLRWQGDHGIRWGTSEEGLQAMTRMRPWN